MDASQLLKELRETQEERASRDRQTILRFRNGSYQSKCITCPGNIWVKITEQCATKLAEKLI